MSPLTRQQVYYILIAVIIIAIVAAGLYLSGILGGPTPTTVTTLPSAWNEISEDELIKKAKEEGIVLSYGMPDGWAAYGILWPAFTSKYGIQHSDTDMASAQVIATLEASGGKPQTDVADIGIMFADMAVKKNLTDCYKPKGWDLLPDQYKDPNGCWFAPYYGAMAFIVNKEILSEKGIPIPRSWKDLLNPIYKGMISYMDPTKSSTGLMTVLTAALANGGSEYNWTPGIEFLKKLHEIGNIKSVEEKIPTAKFQKGDIPILINFDYNGLTWKYSGNFPDIEVVIPEDGSLIVPYAVFIAKGAPHPYAARLFMNFYLSDEGQALLARAFVHPSRLNVTIPPDILAKFPPAEAYKSARVANWTFIAQHTADIANDYRNIVGPVLGLLGKGIGSSDVPSTQPIVMPSVFLIGCIQTSAQDTVSTTMPQYATVPLIIEKNEYYV